jgi:tetratricopeptide (TPR) repeat protein
VVEKLVSSPSAATLQNFASSAGVGWRACRARNVLRRTLLVLATVVAAASASSCSGPWQWGGEPGAHTLKEAPTSGPLPAATAVLDDLIAAGERAQRISGRGVDPKRMAHLHMTRAARDLMADGRTERARDMLERAIAVDGREGFGYLYLAELHLEAGRPEQARVFLDRAVALLPPDSRLSAEIDALRARTGALSMAEQAVP